MPHGKKDKSSKEAQQTRFEELERDNERLRIKLNHYFSLIQQNEAYTLQLKHDHQNLEKHLKEERHKRNELEKTHNKTVALTSETEIICTLKEDVKRLKLELDKKEREITELKHSMAEFQSRLSQDVAENETHTSQGVADLSGSQRPQKLVEKISMLFDYKWIDAFEKSEEKGSERQICIYLLDLFKTCWKFCKETAQTHFDLMVDTLLMKPEDDSQSDANTPLSSKGIKLLLRDFRITSAKELLPNLYKKFKSSRIAVKEDLQPYVEGCLEVCWYSALYEPQLHFVFEPDGQPEDFRKYTKSGNRVDFVVWPAMYLYDNGPLMYKGVAQFTD